MKALSLWQPHALAIAIGLKPWETRDWEMRHRGPLAIHAAKRPWNDSGEWHAVAGILLARRLLALGKSAYPELLPEEQRLAAVELKKKWLVFGAVQCVVDVVDCVRTSELRGRIPAGEEFWGDFSDGETGRGRWAFKLENVRPLAQPLPWKGAQGFFEVDLGADSRESGPGPLFEVAR